MDALMRTQFNIYARKYTVDKIVRHVGSANNIKYVIQWCGYSARDDTIRLPNDIPQLLLQNIDPKNLKL